MSGTEYHLHENTIIEAQSVSAIQQDTSAPTSVTIIFTNNNFIHAPLIGGIPNYPVDGSHNWWGDMTEEDVVNWHQDAPGYGSVQVLPVRKEPVPVSYITGILKDVSGKPIVGARVVLQGTNFETKTAVDGSFFFAAGAGHYILEVSDSQALLLHSTTPVSVEAAELSTCNTQAGELICSSTITGIESNEPILPETANLDQNYPNPFNPTTTIRFYLTPLPIWWVTLFLINS